MDNIVENFLELVDIEDIKETNSYVNMVDITVEEDESFLLSNGIVSHNSASGNFRECRNPQTQGFYCLRGKFINSRLATNKAILANEEAKSLLSSIGLFLDEDVDDDDIRYGKIIIATDADCIEENTPIVTKEGIKPIKEVTINDKVLTHNNKFKQVKQVIEQEKTSYIKIKINGEIIIFSENHKLVVERDGNIIEILAKDIKYSDSFLLKR